MDLVLLLVCSWIHYIYERRTNSCIREKAYRVRFET